MAGGEGGATATTVHWKVIYYICMAGFRFDRYIVYRHRLRLFGYSCRGLMYILFVGPCSLLNLVRCAFLICGAFFKCSCSHTLFVLAGGNNRRVDSLAFFNVFGHIYCLFFRIIPTVPRLAFFHVLSHLPVP